MDKELAKKYALEALGPASHWDFNPVYPMIVERLTNVIIEAVRSQDDRLRCDDCGKLYSEFPLDVVIPDDQWKAITGRTDGGGILCAACIVKRGAKLSGITVAKMVFE